MFMHESMHSLFQFEIGGFDFSGFQSSIGRLFRYSRIKNDLNSQRYNQYGESNL